MLKFLRNFLLLSIFSISSVFAVGDAFDQARFDQLLQDGQPVLIAIHADWCSTCRAQSVLLKDLLKTPPYDGLQVLRVDFDKQKEVVRAFKARTQSTLIVFKNGKEVDRSIADTNMDSVITMLRKAL